jgi:cytoskeletal protein RodZ
MASVKERYEEALALAKAGKYDQARQILKTLNHPKARELEAKINAKAPTNKPKRGRNIALLSFLLVAIVVIGFGVWTFIQRQQTSGQIERYARVFGYCLRVADTSQIEICDDWAEVIATEEADTVNACHNNSPELDTPFYECLSDEGINVSRAAIMSDAEITEMVASNAAALDMLTLTREAINAEGTQTTADLYATTDAILTGTP